MNDLELMQKIKSELGDYITGACEGTPFRPSLLAALAANESSGVANAQRFEPTIFAELAEGGPMLQVGHFNVSPLEVDPVWAPLSF